MQKYVSSIGFSANDIASSLLIAFTTKFSMFSPVSSAEDSDLEVIMSPAIQVNISSITSSNNCFGSSRGSSFAKIVSKLLI